MNSYYELALTVPAERRKLALDLAEQLDALSGQLSTFAEVITENPNALDEPEESKLYFAAMRAFLAAQKQFEKLLPPLAGAQTADPLTEFNTPSVYAKRGVLSV